jgi:hypothetical protein
MYQYFSLTGLTILQYNNTSTLTWLKGLNLHLMSYFSKFTKEYGKSVSDIEGNE